MESEKREAWGALVRLLRKLDLIDPDGFEKIRVPPNSSVGPVAYGASLGLFEENDALRILGEKLEVPVVRVHRHSIDHFARMIDSALLDRLPLEQWKELRCLPTRGQRGELLVAMANPLDQTAKKSVDFAIGETGRLALATESDILTVLARKGSLAHEQSVSDFLELPPETSLPPPMSLESIISTTETDAAPIIRLVNQIFMEALDGGASDIHVTPEREALAVRMRVDGTLVPLMQVPGHLTAGVVSRIKLLAGLDIAERRHPQDGRMRLTVGHHNRDLRISTIPTLHGEKVVARILNSDATTVTFESLGMPEDVREAMERDLSGTSQMILVTGPTGSGKTSTLYAAIMQLRDGKTNIVTIEDPIEYRVEGIAQVQVNTRNGMTFADALRSVLRQDPDIVVVGEIRDVETAEIAMKVAQTGHVVLATLHANSAAAAITRLADLGIPRYLIAASVRGVLAQRLMRKVCGECHGRDDKVTECKACHATGYDGRTGVYSYLRVSPIVRDAIRDGVSERELEELAAQNGFRSLQQDATRLSAAGVTDTAEALRVVGAEEPSVTRPGFDQHGALRHGDAPVGTLPEHLPLGTPNSGAPRKRRLLLVEDDDNMRAVLAMLFERAMFEVVEAVDGKNALEQVYALRPDVIVCDLMMPKMDGAETVRILRRDPATRAIPVLMLTAAATEENELSLLELGADDFVSKTSSKKVLLARVERLLMLNGA